MKKVLLTAAATAALAAAPAPLLAQSDSPSSARDAIGAILGAVFGDRGATNTLEAQWSAGQTPLTDQRAAFESRVDTDVRSGTLTSATGARLKYDYYELTELEGRYGADRRFTTQERAELTDRYGRLTQVLADGRYADGATATSAEIAEGRAAFEQRVDAAVAARRISRTAGSRLKADYRALVGVEEGYMRDGAISATERSDLDARLDALDVRVGDTGYNTATLTPRARLDAVARALPSSGLSSTAQAQLRTEHADLTRLEAAYARYAASADEKAYLESRLADLEARARVRR